jgi:hypothetical protein
MTATMMSNGAVEPYTMAQIGRTMKREDLKTAEAAVWCLNGRDRAAQRIRAGRKAGRNLATWQEIYGI